MFNALCCKRGRSESLNKGAQNCYLNSRERDFNLIYTRPLESFFIFETKSIANVLLLLFEQGQPSVEESEEFESLKFWSWYFFSQKIYFLTKMCFHRTCKNEVFDPNWEDSEKFFSYFLGPQKKLELVWFWESKKCRYYFR